MLSCALQAAKIYFAHLGHADLVFDNHVLTIPEHARWRLGYYNVPLGITYGAEILLLALCLTLSAVATASLKGVLFGRRPSGRR
ncbi:hypothetical protein DFR70_103114 [Nocardia tenerifensis]|uniref:Uncharacterized protein n=1 Tax=Nocardia tenerifensis TaxID=228006 RepID=A0A318K8R1_9NOCA|nr:hypothetical protein DFR70_103114 [Nocardia tenerifensis]